MPVAIRTVEVADAAAFLRLCHQLDTETAFMLFEPGERTTTEAEQTTNLERLLARDNQMIFVAEDDTVPGELVGYVGAFGGGVARNRQTAHIVIGIRQSHVGQGIGTRLFEMLDTWARAAGLHRLELTVMMHNAAGIALYQKMGFVIEGTKQHSLYVDGCYVDELFMGKVLA